MCLRQLHFGGVDMYLHHDFDPDSDVDFWSVVQAASKPYSVIAPLPENRFLCSFSHIFAGGYAAGYYSYKWAEVLSADAFAAFEEAGLDDEEAVQAVGRKYASTVLALGGSKPAAEVYRAFRGRDATVEALLRHNDLLSTGGSR
jgi:oligopeptidase A